MTKDRYKILKVDMFQKRKKIKNTPTHIAFIMDGNRRWAKQRGLNKMLGHKQGAAALKNIIKMLTEIEGVKFASFFAFSTENWNRDQREIDFIFDLAKNLLEENEDDFYARNIKLNVMGDPSKFPKELQDKLAEVTEKTKNNTGLVVNLAINYGGRDDILHSVNKLLSQGKTTVTEEDINQNLYSFPAPDIDFLIRTSGEMRISNFMLFQMAYSELYFTKTYWPDFGRKELDKAIEEYSKRNRRFGGK